MEIILGILLIIYLIGVVVWPLLLWITLNSEAFKAQSDISPRMIKKKSLIISIGIFAVLWPVFLLLKPFMKKREPYQQPVQEDDIPWYEKVDPSLKND